MSPVAHQAGAYPGFLSMRRPGVFPPEMDASPMQDYPPEINFPVPIYTPGCWKALWELSVWPKDTTQRPGQGLNPDHSIRY